MTVSPVRFSNKYGILLYVAWGVSLSSTLGSLFFEFVMKFPPCALCWYQRLCMYPLVIILALGVVLRDKNVFFYSIPFAALGFLTAVYHNLLYYGVIPESLTPCTADASCTTKQLELFGFFTIPLMALVAFGIILFCLGLHKIKEFQKV